ncbi:23S rRNA pseudouridine(2604) synthase RluF [Microvirga sp. STS02]|uniref:23S rRNA pseudouridine(2604) synthase RluF n=1 Tax=Hymenobacter negativus TaxID=2795026 RepID=UPI0018DC6EAE|nr:MULTISPECIES: 23S rRNA pseudouridine(2604) synthase RluF [Bacteria]MBH8568503.1 23S rRNA pseudouridine(2604) synthase RluF [Hymenobacter negativus]MBR7208237.1 23S rRNA pseudouridine(2604) synthase RluF [Microvirga sp. STS02]
MPAASYTRLNKFISESGLCSRREADRYIAEGAVLLNGKPAQIGDQVGPRDRVTVNGHKLEPKQAEDAVYLAFNKPVGITSTSEPGVRGNIVDYVNHAARVFPIGRLDKDSSGLIFLTSDGDIVNKILRAGNQHEKEYVVTVDRILTDRMLDEMAHGIPMLGTVTKKCVIQKETPYIFRITLVQGLNRQIRRMVEHFGYEVVKLERVRIMNISLKGLPVGDWREMTPEEVAGIMKMVAHSSGTEEASGGRSRPKTTKSAPQGHITNDGRPAPRPRKPGPPTMFNPSGTGWWGPRPEKPGAAGTKPGQGGTKRPAKAGSGSGSARPKSGSASGSARPKTGNLGTRPAASGKGKSGTGRKGPARPR